MQHTAVRNVIRLLVWLALTMPAYAEKKVALIIGNSAYQSANPLPNPKNDAIDLEAALKKLGFEVLLGIDLDKAALDRKTRDFANVLPGASAALFFYAGHGLQVGGVNYLVPIDAKLTTAAALDFEMVRLDLVQRTMERETKTNILFLDACRDNPLSRNLARAMGTRSIDIGRGLAAIESGVGTLISYSTQPGNVALDGSGRNSPYAKALLKHLSVPDEDLQSILISVRKSVIAETKGSQVPWEHSALTDRFYFSAPPQKLTASLPVTSDAYAPNNTLEKLVIAQWDGSISSQDAEFYRFVEENEKAVVRIEGAASDDAVVEGGRDGRCIIGHTDSGGMGTEYVIDCERQAGEWQIVGYFSQRQYLFKRGHMIISFDRIPDGTVLLQKPILRPYSRSATRN